MSNKAGVTPADAKTPRILWGGGNCPVHPEAVVAVELPSGRIYAPQPAKALRWHHISDGLDGGDIVAFWVLGSPDPDDIARYQPADAGGEPADDRITPEEVARLAHYLDPDAGDDRMTPAEALRAVGYYLDRERSVAVEQPKREWPGPWTRSSDGPWCRFWRDPRYAVNTHGAVYDRAFANIGEVGDLNDPANRRAADAILATICDGDDPHKGSGQYDEQPTPPADPYDPTTIDVSGTGLPGIEVADDGDWCWGDPRFEDWAAEFRDYAWAVFPPSSLREIAHGLETGPEARRLAFEALKRYVDSKRGQGDA